MGVQKAWLAGLQVGRWGRVDVRRAIDGALRVDLCQPIERWFKIVRIKNLLAEL